MKADIARIKHDIHNATYAGGDYRESLSVLAGICPELSRDIESIFSDISRAIDTADTCDRVAILGEVNQRVWEMTKPESTQ